MNVEIDGNVDFMAEIEGLNNVSELYHGVDTQYLRIYAQVDSYKINQ